MSKNKKTPSGFEAPNQTELRRPQRSSNVSALNADNVSDAVINAAKVGARIELSDEQAMDIARKLMREDKEVLKKLAE